MTTWLLGLGPPRARRCTRRLMPYDASTSSANSANGLPLIHQTASRHAKKFKLFLAIARMQRNLAAPVPAPATASPPHASESPVTVVTSDSDLEAIPFWKQGDPDQDTAEAWDARRRLRHDPEVETKLELWWATALGSVQSDGSDLVRSLNKDDYVRLSRLMHKAMIEVWDAEDAQMCAEEDWLTDAAGRPSIDKDKFLDCIFEARVAHTRLRRRAHPPVA